MRRYHAKARNKLVFFFVPGERGESPLSFFWGGVFFGIYFFLFLNTRPSGTGIGGHVMDQKCGSGIRERGQRTLLRSVSESSKTFPCVDLFLSLSQVVQERPKLPPTQAQATARRIPPEQYSYTASVLRLLRNRPFILLIVTYGTASVRLLDRGCFCLLSWPLTQWHGWRLKGTRCGFVKKRNAALERLIVTSKCFHRLSFSSCALYGFYVEGGANSSSSFFILICLS